MSKSKNSMRGLIILVVLFFLFSGNVYSQEENIGWIRPTPTTHTQLDQFTSITLKLFPPEMGKLRIADFWRVSLINTTQDTLKIFLFGELSEKKAGIIVRATTTDFDLKPGTKILKASDFPTQPEVSYFGNPKYKEALITKGCLPPGDYTYCVYAVSVSTKKAIGSDCLDQIIEDMEMISLISPNDEEEINTKTPIIFTWMSTINQRDVTYTLKIVEIREGQTPDVAFQRNNAWFEQSNIRGITFEYPKSAKPLEDGKKYAWEVISEQTQSEINSFKAGEVLATFPITTLIPVGNGTCKFNIWVAGHAPYCAFKFKSTQAPPNNIISVTPINSDYSLIGTVSNSEFIFKKNSGEFLAANTNVGTVEFSSAITNIPIEIYWAYNCNPPVTFPHLPDFKTLQCTPTTPCPGNIIQNWSFVDGAIPGSMVNNQGGQVSNWTLVPYVIDYWAPRVYSEPGCDVGTPSNGYIYMRGCNSNGDAIQQTLNSPILLGHTYKVELCAKKNLYPRPNDFIQFEIRASNASLPNHGCTGTPGNCAIIGITSQITNTNWSTYTLNNWTADADYNIVTISAKNSSNNLGDTTAGLIDNICIYEVQSNPCQCGTWNNKIIKMILNPDENPTPVTFDCGDGKEKNVLVGTSFSFIPGGTITCNPSECNSSKFTVKLWENGILKTDPDTYPNGVEISTFNTNFKKMTNNKIRLRFYFWCGDNICDSCDIRIDPVNCICSHNDNATVGWIDKPVKIIIGNSPAIGPFHCPKNHTYQNITELRTTKFLLEPNSYRCVPIFPGCYASYTYKVWKKQTTMGTAWDPVKSGTGSFVHFTNSDNLSGGGAFGLFKVEFYAKCNGIECPVCVINLRKKINITPNPNPPLEKSDFLNNALKLGFTIDEDNITSYEMDDLLILSNITGSENYSIDDLKKGKNLLFGYALMNEETEGYYTIKCTLDRDGKNGRAEIIDSDKNIVAESNIVCKEMNSKTNPKDIKITIEKDPGGPCGITVTWYDEKQSPVYILEIPFEIKK